MRVAALLAVAFILSGCAMGGTKTTTVTVTHTVTSPSKKPPAAMDETASVKYFGTPVSATKVDQKCPQTVGQKTVYFSCYSVTIKPEFFLVGVTANSAFAAGETPPVACDPLACKPVEDDHWIIPAGDQDLVFLLPSKATGTVLPANSQQETTKVTGDQLAALIGGATTPKLIEPLSASGVWFTVNVDTVTSFSQQFEP